MGRSTERELEQGLQEKEASEGRRRLRHLLCSFLGIYAVAGVLVQAGEEQPPFEAPWLPFILFSSLCWTRGDKAPLFRTCCSLCPTLTSPPPRDACTA